MRQFVILLKEAISEWSKDKAPRLAAALAYYTAFSLAPLLIIVIQLGALILGGGHASGHHQVFRNEIFGSLAGVVGSKGADAVRGIVDSLANQPKQGLLAGVLSWAFLLWGALGLVDALQDALNTVWHVSEKALQGREMEIRKRLLSFAMIAGVAFILIVSLVVNTTLSAFTHLLLQGVPALGFLVRGIDFLVSFTIVTLLFALIYKYLPDVRVEWRNVWAGAAVTAILFSAGQFLLAWYLARASTTSAYGAAGSLVLILLWVFYSAQILLFGAEFTKVFTGHKDGKLPTTQPQS